GNDTYEDLTVDRFEEIVDAFAAGNGASITPGPQIERQFSAAEGGATTLTEPPTAERTYKPFPPPPPPATAPGAPAAAPAAPARAARPAAAASKPDMPGRKAGAVPEESAPAIKEPQPAPKLPESKAEAEREAFGKAAGADGEPARAMRDDATGA